MKNYVWVLLSVLFIVACVLPVSVSADTAIIYPVYMSKIWNNTPSEFTFTQLTSNAVGETYAANGSASYEMGVEYDAGSTSNKFIFLSRTFITFGNISAQLPSGATISSAYVHAYMTDNNNNLNSNGNLVFVGATPVRPIDIREKEYKNFTSTALTVVNSTTGKSINTWIDFPLNANGLSWLSSPNDGNYNVLGFIIDDDRAGTFSGTWADSHYWTTSFKGMNNANKLSLIVTYTTGAPPVASFTKDKTFGAAPLTVTFTDTSTNAPTSWLWVFGDGDNTNSTVQHPIHTYASAGTYNANVTATNGYGSNTAATQAINVGNPPVASFTKDKTGGLSPVTVVFTDTSTNTPTFWLWVFGDGSVTNQTQQNPVHTFTGAGTYNVNLTATNAYGSSTTATQAITVGLVPVASFTKDKTFGASPLTVTFTDTSSGAPSSWYWVFGDGSATNQTQQNPVHTFTGAGTYNVNLTATNVYGDNTTATQAITVGTAPVASFSKDKTNGMFPLTVVFTDTSTGAPSSWLWVFGDGSSVNATQQSPVHTFANVGTYNVNLTATNAYGVSTTATQAITVKSFGGLGAGTSGDPFQITTTDEMTQIVNNLGSYYKLMNNVDFLNYGDISPVTQNATPYIFTGNFNGNGKIVSNATVHYGNSTSNVGFGLFGRSYGTIHDLQINNITLHADPSKGYLYYGALVGYSDGVIYNIFVYNCHVDKYIEENSAIGGAVGYNMGTIHDVGVYLTDVQNTGGNSGIGHAYGGGVIGIDGGGSSTKIWTKALVKIADFSPSTRGAVIGSGSVSSSYFDSLSTPNVDGSATSKTTAEMQTQSTFSGWDFSTIWSMSTVGGTYNGYPIFKWMVVYTQPIVSFTKSTALGVLPLTVQFTDTSTGGIDSWYWVFGDSDNTNSTVQSPIHTFASPGTYNVNLTITNPLGTNTSATQSVEAGYKPVASFTQDKTIGLKPLTVVFTWTGSGQTSVLWQFGDGSTTNNTQLSPVHTFATDGNYTVNVTATNTYGDTKSTSSTVDAGTIGSNDWSWWPYSPRLVGNSFTYSMGGGQKATLPYTTSWRATAPNGTMLYGVNNPFTGDVPGTWYIGMTIINRFGTYVSPNYSYVYYLSLTPSFTKSNASGEAPLPVLFTSSSGTGSKPTSWLWVSSDGWSSTLENPLHSFGAGAWNVNLTSYNSTYSISNTTATQQINVGVNPPTNVGWTANITSGTGSVGYSDSLGVAFTPTYTGGTPTSYSWYINGTHYTTQIPEHSFTTNSTFWVNVTLVNTDGSGYYNGTYVVTLKPPHIDTLNTGNSTPISGSSYAPVSVSFTRTFSTYSGGVHYGYPDIWCQNWGDGVNSCGGSPSHTYTTNGTFHLVFNLTNSGGIDTFAFDYNVRDPEAIPSGVSWTTNVTPSAAKNNIPQYILFTPHQTGGALVDTYNWHFAGNADVFGTPTPVSATLTNAAPSVLFAYPGTYWVNLTMTNATWGSGIYNQTFTVGMYSPYPMTSSYSIDMSYPILYANATYHIVDMSYMNASYPSYSYLWHWGDGTADTTSVRLAGNQTYAYHNFTAVGNYTITFDMINPGGTRSFSFFTMNVSSAPAQATPIVRWLNQNGDTITTISIGHNNTHPNEAYVTSYFNTVTKGVNPPLGYFHDYFYLVRAKQDPTTGIWAEDHTDYVYSVRNSSYGMDMALLAYTQSMDTFDGTRSWLGYYSEWLPEGKYRFEVIGYNTTNPALYPSQSLGRVDVTVLPKTLDSANVGDWADNFGGEAFKYVLAAVIVLFLMFLPFLITREFNAYIEVIMAILGIGADYYYGLIPMWVIFGLAILAIVVIFFMAKGGNGGGEVEEIQGEVG